MLKKDFWYDLPKELIAQEPADPRDSARLMVLDRKNDTIEHRIFHDLPEYLNAGDVLVVNNSKVLPARLMGVKLLTLSNFAAGFTACFNSSLLPPNSSLVFFPFFQCGKQAAQADVDGAKVGDLVNFQLGVQLAAFLQNFAGLVGGNGIQAATEGYQLHQVHIRSAV